MPRVVVLLVLIALPVLAQPRPQFEVVVERLLIDVTVTDSHGAPIADLRPSNFVVKLGGVAAEIEAVEFVDLTDPEFVDRDPIPAAVDPGGPEPSRPPGRLFVFLFQTDFQRANSRIRGHMAALDHARAVLDRLEPQDRVAVAQFDSHLKVRLDFTGDRKKILDAIRRSVRIEPVSRPERVPLPSLMSRLDEKEMKAAASPERALTLLGNALRIIPGAKTLVVFGWGLGRYDARAGAVSMTPDYGPAKRALEASRTTVYSMDFSQANYHSLEEGLKIVAKDTGGFYARLWQHPQQGIDKLANAVSARYELVVKWPADVPKGLMPVEVTLRGVKGATVRSRDTIELR